MTVLRYRPRPFLLLLLLPACSLAGAQTPASAPPSLATQMVSAVAPAGLTRADFTVAVNGSPQAITYFQEVTPAVSEWKPAATTIGQYTNADAAHEPQRATAVVLDTIHTLATDEGGVRAQVLKYLADASSRREMVAVFVLSDKGLELVHDLRVDPSVLADVMKQVQQGGGGKSSAKTLPVTLAGASREQQTADEAGRLLAFVHGYEANPTPSNTQPRGNIELPLRAWQVLAQYLGGVQGRKSVVWLSARIPFELDTSNGSLIPPSLMSTASVVNGQAVSGGRINSISAADLKRYEILWERAIQALQQNDVAITVVEIRPAGTAASQTQATMESLAEMTGGKLYWAANDMNAAIADASQLFSHFYRLGYARTAAGGPWVKQVVRTKGDERALAANGFFNTATTSDLAATRQADFDNAFQLPVDQTAVPFVIQTGDGEAAGAKKRVPVIFLMPGGSFAIDRGNQNKLGLDFAAAAFDRKGGVAGQYSSSINTNLPEGAVEQIQSNGTSVKAAIDLPPGDYTVRCVVRDDLTGKVGSLLVPVSVK